MTRSVPIAGGARRFSLMSLFAPYQLILTKRRILFGTTLSELRATYAGSFLGSAWVVVGPLFLLVVYALVYAVIFRIRPTGMTVEEYVLYVFSGLVPFMAFSSALNMGSLSISTNRALLFNTVFPSELIVVRSILVASASLPAGFLLLVVGDAAFGEVTATLLAVPIVIVLQAMFVTGVCWVLSLLTLVIRDIEQLLTYITLLLLVVTPIAYTPGMVPANLKVLMAVNPLYYFVTSYQSLVVLDQLPSARIIAIEVALSAAMFTVGFLLFSRLKQAFMDYA